MHLSRHIMSGPLLLLSCCAQYWLSAPGGCGDSLSALCSILWTSRNTRIGFQVCDHIIHINGSGQMLMYILASIVIGENTDGFHL